MLRLPAKKRLSPQKKKKKKHNAKCLKRFACQAKWRWRSPKRCACHEIGNSSSKSLAKAWACDAKRVSTLFCRHMKIIVRKRRACHAKRHYTPSKRRGLDGCAHQSSVERTRLSPQTPSKTRTLPSAFGKHYLSSSIF